MIIIYTIIFFIALLGINLIYSAINDNDKYGAFKLLAGIFILSFALTAPVLVNELIK